MRTPLPRNRLVQLTLVGALLTTLVAGGLLAPGLGTTQSDTADSTTNLGPDAPTPNENFTPAQSAAADGGYEADEAEDDEREAEDEEKEYQEYEQHEEEEEYEEHEEDDEYESVEDRAVTTGINSGGRP